MPRCPPRTLTNFPRRNFGLTFTKKRNKHYLEGMKYLAVFDKLFLKHGNDPNFVVPIKNTIMKAIHCFELGSKKYNHVNCSMMLSSIYKTKKMFDKKKSNYYERKFKKIEERCINILANLFRTEKS